MKQSTKQSLWDYRVDLPRLWVIYAVSIPIFGLGIFYGFVVGNVSVGDALGLAAIAITLAYGTNLVALLVYRKGSRWFSTGFKRLVRSATEDDNRELDNRIADLSREVATKLSLTPEQSELLLTALNNSLGVIKHEEKQTGQ